MELEEIKKEITSKFDEQIESLKTVMTEEISSSMKAIEKVIDTKVQASENRLIQMVDDLKIQISNLKDEHTVQMAEFQDRSLRSTLIFRGVKYDARSEKNPHDTINVLANIVSKHCPTIGEEFFKNAVERGHRNLSKKKKDQKPKGPPSISVKFLSWKDSNNLLNEIIKVNSNKTNKLFLNVSQQFSDHTNERRNSALIHRKELLNTHKDMEYRLAYPATLLGRKKGSDGHFKTIKDF